MIKSNCINSIMRRYSKLSSKGFSILETIVALGLVSILGFAITSLMMNLSQQNKKLQQKLESVQLEQSISRLLVDAGSCNCLFVNTPWSGADISFSSLKNGCSGNDLIKKDDFVSSVSLMKVKDIRIINPKNLGSDKVSADIEISFKDTLESIKPIVINSQPFVIESGKIKGCMGIPGSKQICESMGGTWSQTGCLLASQTPPAQTCSDLGGVWNGTKCSMGDSSNTSQICTDLGGAWDGSKCSFVAGNGGNSNAKTLTCPSKTISCGMWNLNKCQVPVGSQGQFYYYQAGACGSSTDSASLQCIDGKWAETPRPPLDCQG